MTGVQTCALPIFGWDIIYHDGVGPDHDVVTNGYAAKQFGSCTDDHIASQLGETWRGAYAKRDLLVEFAVRTDMRFRVDDYAIGVWNEQAALQVVVEWYVRTADSTPYPKAKYNKAEKDSLDE